MIRRCDVVIVAIPFTDAAQSKVRPALIVQNDRDIQTIRKTVIAMITGNIRRRTDPSHLFVDPHDPLGASSGLSFPSLDKAQTTGFRGVREDVWNFHIGCYQVCQKWLKDRKGRAPSKDDIAHYHKIVVAISETMRLMKEIDQAIDKHGGWPGAFAAAKEA